MRNTINLSVGLFVSLILIGCDSDKCFYRSGEMTQKVLSERRYSYIHNYGLFDIELVQDTCYFVEGFAGANVLENIELNFKGDTLELYNNNSCFWLRDYVKPILRLHFSDIKQVNLYETSYLYSIEPITDDFSCSAQAMLAEIDLVFNNHNFYFYVHHKTGGQYTFSGKTESLYLNGYYCSVFDASNLESKQATIKNHSIADFKVWATEELHAEIYNRGNIYYKGSPRVFIDSLVSAGRVLPMPN